MRFVITCLSVVVVLLVGTVSAFSLFNDIFEDLRVGSGDSSYIGEKLTGLRSKCLDGSHFFNGSCYFISNRKHSADSSFPMNEFDLALNLARERKKNSFLPSSLDSTPLGTQIVAASIPSADNWEAARRHCAQLNNDSSLIVIENDLEYEFLEALLFQLNSVSLTNSKEAIYHIGLRYLSEWSS